MKMCKLFPNLATGLILSTIGSVLAPSVQGQIFISYNNGTVRQFDAGGVAASFATGLNTPKGLALKDGFLFVANSGNQNVMKFTAPHTGSLFSNIYNQSPDFIAIQFEPTVSDIAMYAGLTLQGVIGCRYRIEYTTSLNPNPIIWTQLATLTLSSNPTLYVDTSAPESNTRFYRALSVQ